MHLKKGSKKVFEAALFSQMVPSRGLTCRGQTILTKTFWVLSNPLEWIFSKSREYLNLRIQFMSPCFPRGHGGILIFNVGKPRHPSSFILLLLLHDFRISQVILAFRVNASFLGCAAFGSSVLHFWELGICSFLKTTVTVSSWFGASHTYLTHSFTACLVPNRGLHTRGLEDQFISASICKAIYQVHVHGTVRGSGQSREMMHAPVQQLRWNLRVAHPIPPWCCYSLQEQRLSSAASTLSPHPLVSPARSLFSIPLSHFSRW